MQTPRELGEHSAMHGIAVALLSEDREQLSALQRRLEETRLGYENAKAGVAKVKADVTATEAHLEAAGANWLYSWTMLEYAWIKAPYAGVVTQRNVNTDDFVQPAVEIDHGAAARALMKTVDVLRHELRERPRMLPARERVMGSAWRRRIDKVLSAGSRAGTVAPGAIQFW